MKYFRNVLTHLEFFIHSPVFPLSLSLIIFILCRTFDSINLCDDDGLLLSQLQIGLEYETENFTRIAHEKRFWYNQYQELLTKKMNSDYSNPELEEVYKTNIKDLRDKFYESWEKIQNLKKDIKKLDI